MTPPQVVTNIRRGLARAGLRRKVPDTNPLLKPKLFSQWPQIQRPTLPTQKPLMPRTQILIHPISVGRKQIIQLNHRPKVPPNSEVKSREVTKQDRHY